MKKTKICFIITRLIAGGAQKVLLDIIANLPKDSYDIYLISGTETGKEGSLWEALSLLLEDKKVYKIPSLIRSINPFKDYAALKSITKLLKQIQPDVIHTHTSKAGVIGRYAAIKSKCPVIVHSTHGLIYNTDANIPGVNGGLSVKAFKAVETYLGKHTDTLITLSEEETGDAIKLNLALPANIKSISNGIPLKELEKIPREETEWKVPHIRLGIAGRLNKEKGHELLLKSVKLLVKDHPNISLKIAGTGPLLEELKELTQELNIAEHVFFEGFHHDISQFLKNIDIFICSSHYEGFGLVIVEAMAAGLPVVATDVGGVREVVKDGVTGILVPPGSEIELRSGIEYFLQNPKLAYQFGQKGRQYAMENYSIRKMMEKHLAVYQQKPKNQENSLTPPGYALIDLHNHSKHSFDSKTPVEEVIKQAKRRGLSALAITDHDNLDGALEAMKKAPDDLIIIPGMEITSDVGDIIALFINEPIQSTQFPELIDEIRAQDGLVYLPHPFRGRRSISLDLVKSLDVFEVFNGRSQGINLNDDSFGNQDIVNFASSYNLTGIGGSDGHRGVEVGHVATCVPEFNTAEDLKLILKSGLIFPVLHNGDWVEESITPEFEHIVFK